MSRIERIQTKQGHPVPSRSLPTQGPFPREIFTHPPVVENYDQISGNGGPEVPFGSTAQNNFKPLKWFRCKGCSLTIKELDIQYHVCEVIERMYLNDYEDDYYEDDEDEDYYEDEDDEEYSDGRNY